MAADTDEVDIKVIQSDDGEIFWLQMKCVAGKKLSPDQFILELETYLNEISKAYEQRESLGKKALD